MIFDIHGFKIDMLQQVVTQILLKDIQNSELKFSFEIMPNYQTATSRSTSRTYTLIINGRDGQKIYSKIKRYINSLSNSPIPWRRLW